jgi:hypothetical protein
MNFRAAGMHYLGLEALRLGQKDVGLQRLQAAFEYSRSRARPTRSRKSPESGPR